MSPIPQVRRAACARRRGFTLLESMFSVAVLFAVVVSVTGAISAGHQHAMEAHQRIAGGIAAQDLMGRVMLSDYADLPTWHGFAEPVGTMVDMASQPMPETFARIGRDVEVTSTLEYVDEIDIWVEGRRVRVEAFDADGRVLADLETFVVEPQEVNKAREKAKAKETISGGDSGVSGVSGVGR